MLSGEGGNMSTFSMQEKVVCGNEMNSRNSSNSSSTISSDSKLLDKTANETLVVVVVVVTVLVMAVL